MEHKRSAQLTSGESVGSGIESEDCRARAGEKAFICYTPGDQEQVTAQRAVQHDDQG